MWNIQWTSPHPWVWVLVAVGCGSLIAYQNLRTLNSARKFWGDTMMLNRFSPESRGQAVSLWVQWVMFLSLLSLALAGPNLSTAPETVASGAVQVEFVYDVSPSEGAQDTRTFHETLTGERDPGHDFEWGTRLDVAKFYTKTDLLPQVANNEAGIVTMEGVGYNMWDITPDLGQSGAFYHMLDKFVQVGAAPGGGANYASGLQTALDEFDLISKMEVEAGDKTDKVRFVVFFSDGGNTGDQTELNKVLDEYNKRHVRLLIVAIGGSADVSVPKYDPTTHRRTGESYKGLTRLDLKTLLQMKNRVAGAELITATPGTAHIHYSFPEKAGGMLTLPTESNLKPWLLAIAILLFVSITAGGGGLPRWRYFLPNIRGLRNSRAVSFIMRRLGRTN